MKAGDFVRWVSNNDAHPTGATSEPRWKIGIVSGDDKRKDPIPVIQLLASESGCTSDDYGQGCLFLFPASELTVLTGYVVIPIKSETR